MKRVSFLMGFALFALFIFSNSGTNAVNQSITEKFGGWDDKKDTTDYSGTYNFDKAHSMIGFRVRHNGLAEVLGFFRDFKGTVNYDQKDVSKSTVEFTAQATSVDTGVAARDNHLRTADFFDVANNKEITFKSTKVAKKGKQWMLTGDFTLRGVTKSITFPFNIVGFLPGTEKSGPRMGLTAQTTINRRDYGVNFGSTLPSGALLLSDDVKIDLQLETVGPKPPAAAGGSVPSPKP
jgi:polyisoprenoid-binding protein YceI